MSQGMARITGDNPKEAESTEDSTLGTAEGARPADTLSSDVYPP